MASREGYDLFNKWGRRAFFRHGLFGDRWARKHVLIDTFGHHICAIIGHSKRTWEWDDGIGIRHAICARCGMRTVPYRAALEGKDGR